MGDDGLVYSTETGKGGRALAGGTPGPDRSGRPKPGANLPPNDGVVRLSREKGKRGGKLVTVVQGLPSNQVEPLTPKLKKLCGAGGTHRDGAIEIQGDHRERLAKYLGTLGYTTKLAGG